MNYEQLTEQQKALLATDFGDFEKEAEARLETVQEMYAYGFNKLAKEIQGGVDAAPKVNKERKEETEDDEEQEKKLDDMGEKMAAEMGAFIERGVFDGLTKLGQEQHGDPLFYFYPFIEEKVAMAGAQAALQKLAKTGWLGGVKKKVMGDMGSIKQLGKETWREGKKAITGKGAKGGKLTEKGRSQAKERAMGAGKALAGKAAPYAAGGAAAGGAGYLAMRGKKE